MDGPTDIAIEGDRFICRNTSDGERFCGSFRPEDARITAARWVAAVEEWDRQQVARVVGFQRTHAETA
jgi:hypothetical protein